MGVVGGQSDVLPPLYARWASEFLSGAIPAESEATCSDCAMVSGEGAKARPAAAPFFNPDTSRWGGTQSPEDPSTTRPAITRSRLIACASSVHC